MKKDDKDDRWKEYKKRSCQNFSFFPDKKKEDMTPM